MDEKTKQILAYIFTPIGGLIFYLLKDSSRETKYHAAQSIVIGSIALIFSFINVLNGIMWIAAVVFIVMGIIRAVNEEDPKLPLVSNLVDALFTKDFGDNNTSGKTKEVDAEIKDPEDK